MYRVTKAFQQYEKMLYYIRSPIKILILQKCNMSRVEKFMKTINFACFCPFSQRKKKSVIINTYCSNYSYIKFCILFSLQLMMHFTVLYWFTLETPNWGYSNALVLLAMIPFLTSFVVHLGTTKLPGRQVKFHRTPAVLNWYTVFKVINNFIAKFK